MFKNSFPFRKRLMLPILLLFFAALSVGCAVVIDPSKIQELGNSWIGKLGLVFLGFFLSESVRYLFGRWAQKKQSRESLVHNKEMIALTKLWEMLADFNAIQSRKIYLFGAAETICSEINNIIETTPEPQTEIADFLKSVYGLSLKDVEIQKLISGKVSEIDIIRIIIMDGLNHFNKMDKLLVDLEKATLFIDEKIGKKASELILGIQKGYIDDFYQIPGKGKWKNPYKDLSSETQEKKFDDMRKLIQKRLGVQK